MKPLLWPYNTRGFTLVETIIALSISAILILVIMEFINGSTRLGSYFTNASANQIDSRKSLIIMMHQLREISDGDDGGYAITTANPYQIIFYSDIDKDAAAEQVQYAITNSVLKRTVINPSGTPSQYLSTNGIVTTLANQVVNEQTGTPLFSYYNASNTQLTSPINLKDVTLIKIQLKLPNYSTETYVQLRNLKPSL